MRRAGLVALVALVLAGCTKTETERYSDDCHARGGYVSIQNGWTSTYNCVGQTSGAPMPTMVR